jgi:hypothetical protein
MPEKYEMKELQKTAILFSAHVLGKVLIQKYGRFNWEIALNVP